MYIADLQLIIFILAKYEEDLINWQRNHIKQLVGKKKKKKKKSTQEQKCHPTLSSYLNYVHTKSGNQEKHSLIEWPE